MIKDKVVWNFIARLAEQVDMKALMIIDEWPGDYVAVGVARQGDRDRWVYVTTWGQAESRYACDCDVLVGPEGVPHTVEKGTNLSIDDVALMIRRHLSLAKAC
jgi:hypothetical protein